MAVLYFENTIINHINQKNMTHTDFSPLKGEERQVLTIDSKKITTAMKADHAFRLKELNVDLVKWQEITFWEQPAPKHERWRAENGEGYWYVGSGGMILSDSEENHVADDYRYNTGNYHQTEEQAEQASKKSLALQRVKDKIRELNQGWVVNWENHVQAKFKLAYSNKYKQFKIEGFNWSQYQDKELACKTKEVAEAVLDHFKDDQETLKLAYGI